MVSKRIFVCLFVRICFTWLSVLCKPGNGVVVAIHGFFPVNLYFKCFNRVGWWWLIFELGWWWLIYVTWGLGAIISARPKVSPSPPLQHAQHVQDLCSTSIKHLDTEEYGKIAAEFVVILTQFCNNSILHSVGILTLRVWGKILNLGSTLPSRFSFLLLMFLKWGNASH